MKIELAHLTGKHPNAFRVGEQSIIIGVKIITPFDKTARACFEILYKDGVVDYIPIEEVYNGSYLIGIQNKEE